VAMREEGAKAEALTMEATRATNLNILLFIVKKHSLQLNLMTRISFFFTGNFF
jgi:hypothetical protein